MKIAVTAAALMTAVVFSATAVAQQSAPSQQAETSRMLVNDLPEACRAAGASMTPDMQSMRAQGQKQMQSMSVMVAKMGQTQRALSEAMMKMSLP